MPRKGENIYRRKDGRWEGRFIKGRDLSGKALYQSVYGKKYTEVKLKLLQQKKNIQEYDPQPLQENLNEWLNHWLHDMVKVENKRSTYYSYQYKINQYIAPYIGHLEMQGISKNELQIYLDNLSKTGLSAETIKTVFRILKSSLERAVRESCLSENPCSKIQLGHSNTGKRVHALTIKEQRKLESVAVRDKLCSPILLALYTGLRIGEISALTWKDIDFEEQTLTVNQTMQRVKLEKGTRIIFDRPKSNRSQRVIPLPDHLCIYLKRHQALSQSNYVINCKGGYAEPRVITYRFQRDIKAASVKDICFHDLRHTFATRCMERNIDVATISGLLGHSSIKMTLDTYTDSLMDQKKKAMDMFAFPLT